MKVFLSGLEASPEGRYILEHTGGLLFNLMSYYYLRNSDIYKTVIKKSQEILIDSGAHTFQKGKGKQDWEKYTEEYASWITEHDQEKIIGYFEMDIDPAGYSIEYVEHLRNIMTAKSDKVIPVWHKNRGIEYYKKMVKNPTHKDGIVAITGFRNEDIKDEQYINFLKYAHAYDVKVHCLGMTRRKVLDKVPFDYVDSSSWKQGALYGRARGMKITKEFSKKNRSEVMLQAYLEGVDMQKEYLEKWRNFRRRFGISLLKKLGVLKNEIRKNKIIGNQCSSSCNLCDYNSHQPYWIRCYSVKSKRSPLCFAIL